MSSARTAGRGVDDGHLHSSGLSGHLGAGMDERCTAFSSPLLLLIFGLKKNNAVCVIKPYFCIIELPAYNNSYSSEDLANFLNSEI